MMLIVLGVTALVVLYFLVMQVQNKTPASVSRAAQIPSTMSVSDDVETLEKDLLKLNSTTFEADYQQIMDY